MVWSWLRLLTNDTSVSEHPEYPSDIEGAGAYLEGEGLETITLYHFGSAEDAPQDMLLHIGVQLELQKEDTSTYWGHIGEALQGTLNRSVEKLDNISPTYPPPVPTQFLHSSHTVLLRFAPAPFSSSRPKRTPVNLSDTSHNHRPAWASFAAPEVSTRLG